MSRYEADKVEAARRLMWETGDDGRDCLECGMENPKQAPCCGECGGDLEDDE